ncbi:MarC family protein [Labilibaculum sp.]|uniref:MarC family protein n=1 Tax=Labilibaculum sp. TaxID=2060723 RepID=UPI002AA70AE9|nr:MarC family protein [Labilibaculum sp.]MBN2595400.1 MarC family protein [Marinifilaceae bacterium]
MNFNFLQIITSSMVLFAVIDIIGSIPIILDLQKKGGKIEALKATVVALIVLIAFTFLGQKLLGLFGVDISSFAIAGSFILFIMGVEMALGIEIIKYDGPSGVSIVPIAFPLVAGAGSFTTVLALRAEYAMENLIAAIVLNMIFVYIVLRSTNLVERILGEGGIHVLRKVFGIILLAISVKLFMTNVAIQIYSLFPFLREVL